MSESASYQRPRWQDRALTLLHHTGHWHYLEECREAKEDWDYGQETGKLLAGFRWDNFATLTFKDPVSFDFADRAVRRFVQVLGDTAYAFHGLERGRVGEHVHSHLLLGGIKPRRLRNVIWKTWHHGDLRYEKYDPARGAAWYVTKHFRRSEWGGFVGAPPIRVRRRRRGRRGRRV